MKLWGGRFTRALHRDVEAYNRSLDVDYQLAEFDIQGSLAYGQALKQCGVLTQTELDKITTALHQIQQKLQENTLDLDNQCEDVHTYIEYELYQSIGQTAGKLHTGRSRNDQVALAMHLYLRYELCLVVEKLISLNQSLLHKAESSIDVIMPGYTHLQRAEPIRFAHHWLAYFSMFQRDIERLAENWKRVNTCPLGAGALAGSGLNIDREFLARLLNMEAIYSNSLDAVSDRDFLVEFLSNSTLIMSHLSKLSEEIILWHSHEFDFIELDDQFCTGSSMMPQKKNPDVAELARGKTGRVYGALMSLLTTLKGLPLAYNKDLQEDKEGVFDTVHTLKQTLQIFAPMIDTLRIKREAIDEATQKDYTSATQIANYLTQKGMTFRQAHEMTGKIVFYCMNHHLSLGDLNLSDYQHFSSLIDKEVYEVINVEKVVEAHQTQGGTAKIAVKKQLEQAKTLLATSKKWLTKHRKALQIEL